MDLLRLSFFSSGFEAEVFYFGTSLLLLQLFLGVGHIVAVLWFGVRFPGEFDKKSDVWHLYNVVIILKEDKCHNLSHRFNKFRRFNTLTKVPLSL